MFEKASALGQAKSGFLFSLCKISLRRHLYLSLWQFPFQFLFFLGEIYGWQSQLPVQPRQDHRSGQGEGFGFRPGQSEIHVLFQAWVFVVFI